MTPGVMPQGGTPELVTLGEVLGTMSATVAGPLEVGTPLRLSFAGAEATVAIAVARLGVRSALIGRLGEDAVGRLIRHGLAADGVDVRGLRVDPGRTTGMLLKHPRMSGRIEVSYSRSGSAGSHLVPGDVDEHAAIIRGARILHLTGITPALGADAAAAVRRAVDIAGDAGVAISLDVNHRSRLWSREDAREALRPLARRAEVVVASVDELAIVADDERELLDTGVQEVVVTDGARGARVVTADGRRELDAIPIPVVDPVGAGDALVGGYLAARLRGADPGACLEHGVRVAAVGVATLGDWEGLPHGEEIDLLEGAEVRR